MNLPMSWLRDYMNIGEIETKEYEHKMTMSGSKVEGTERLGGEAENIRTGKILKVEAHPDADKLVVCQVEVGEEAPIQIVTAAPNVFEGAIVPVAMHKSTVYGGQKITRGKLRGVVSDGMFCSTDELGMSKERATGILILPEDTPIGVDACALLGLDEKVVEFEITSNRPDCMSVIGLARETAATFGYDFSVPNPKEYEKISEKAEDNAKVEVLDFDLCPRFLGKVVKNVKIGPSPEWMQKRLAACGIRAINNVVDITNYVMLEYGQPMHAYDLDCVAGKKIIVRRAKDGEILKTLDDQDRTLNSSMICIAVEKEAIGVAGVMGGASSEVTEKTTTVLFEAATFNGTAVRRAAKALGMRTDASALFEKGLDPYNLDGAIERACQLIAKMGAGDVLEGTIEVKGTLKEALVLPFEPERMNAFLGMDISRNEMIDILTSLEFKIEGDKIIVPTFRGDIESMADIAEEVARIYGYDKIPTTLMDTAVTCGGRTPEQKAEAKIKDVLVSDGFDEIITYSFTDPKENELLGIPSDDEKYNFVKILNPLGEENSVMRTTMLASMCEVLKTNYNKRIPSASLFELGSVYINKGETLPDERKTVAIGMYGCGDFYDLKGTIENLFDEMGIKKVKYVGVDSNPTFHPGRCAEIYCSECNKKIGVMGQAHPTVAGNYKINAEVYLAELDFATIFECGNQKKTYKPLPKFPATTRDIAMVVEEDVCVADIADIFEKEMGGILESYTLFDIYRGAQLGENKKSVAYSLSFRASDRTLTDDEVNAVMEKILAGLKNKVGADLR